MKRFISILALLLMIPLGASAQWYLFPLDKKTQEKKDTTAKVKLAVPAEKTEKAEKTVTPVPETYTFSNEVQEPEMEAEPLDTSDVYMLDMPDVMDIAMILPLNVSEKPSSNFLGMYAGGLLAARDLGREGLKINFNIYDSADKSNPLTGGIFDGSDLVIGPVSTNEILSATEIADRRTRIISPLEPKAASLTDSCHVIQAPASWYDQVDKLVEWIQDECVIGDEVVVIKDTVQGGMGEQAAYLMTKIASSGLRHKTVNSASLVPPSSIGNTRYVIASDRDAFISAAVRQIGASTIRRKTGNVYLYLTSKMRNAKGVDVKQLYLANARVTMNYFIDYSDPKVKDFILAYRALFKDEPDSFAFQGYDCVHYFATMCAKYGRRWYKKLPEYSERGLQSNFQFEDSETAGQINRAVRKVIYGRDNSIIVQ